MISISLPVAFETIEIDTRTMSKDVIDLLLQKKNLNEQSKLLDAKIREKRKNQ
jgi:hypothetical protein